MTSKELLYLDDALSHAQFLATQFQDASASLQDGALKQYVTQLAERHKQVYRRFRDAV